MSLLTPSVSPGRVLPITLCCIIAMFAGLASVASASPAQQDVADASSFLPRTTSLFVHVKSPAKLIDKVQQHALVQKAMQLPQVEEFLASPQYAMANLGQKMLESQLDATIIETVKDNAQHGIWFAVDGDTKGAILVFRAADEDRLKRVAGLVLKFIGSIAQQQGQDLKIEKKPYRSAVAANVGKAIIARHKNWFVISNQKELAKRFVDNLLDNNQKTLASEPWFQTQLDGRQNADIWGAANLETVRQMASDNPMFSGKTDNPGVELLFGGILDLLQHAPSVTVDLSLNKELDLAIRSPFNADWVSESRSFFYGPSINQSGKAPLALQPENMIANLTSYRDIGLWWLSKEELYPERVIAQLAQTDSQLSTIFSGMDFGQDVLGALKPGVQIVVAENTYKGERTPDVKLPAFALVGKLKQPDKLRRKLKIAFQSVVGFANINLGMNGQPQLDLDNEKVDGVQVASASYFVEEGTEEGLLLFNFAPTIAFYEEHLVISTNKQFALELADLLKAQGEQTQESVNTKLHIDGPMLSRILQVNSESMITQNMLEEGNDRDTAEQQINLILSVLKFFKDGTMEYSATDKEMKLDVQIRTK